MKRIALFVVFYWSFVAIAYLATEKTPGQIKLVPSDAKGIQVISWAERKNSAGTWVYFCISTKRCFYSKKKNSKVTSKKTSIKSLVYSLSPRLMNDTGSIAIGAERYFYPILEIEVIR